MQTRPAIARRARPRPAGAERIVARHRRDHRQPARTSRVAAPGPQRVLRRRRAREVAELRVSEATGRNHAANSSRAVLLDFEANSCHFLLQSAMAKRLQTTEKQVFDRIYGHGKGWVFTPRHFLNLGHGQAITSALKRHTDAGRIRTVRKGPLRYSETTSRLGSLSPTADAVAHALAGRRCRTNSNRAVPTRQICLDCPSRVPLKVVFLTDGPSRRAGSADEGIILKRTTPRNMATANRRSGLVIQALRQLGQRSVDRSTIEILRRRLSENDKQQLLKDVRYAPAWIAKAMREIANSPKDV